MADEPEHTDVPVAAGTVVEIDANIIANIILRECHTTTTRSIVAANLIIEYLAKVHGEGSMVQ